jgi:hypothetical protein
VEEVAAPTSKKVCTAHPTGNAADVQSKKKNKKKKKKPTAVTVPGDEDDEEEETPATSSKQTPKKGRRGEKPNEMDEVDKALAELNMKYVSI